jgi:hypothetical protein
MSVHPRVDGTMRTADSDDEVASSAPSVIPFGRQHTLALRSDAETGELRLGDADGRELVLIEVGSQGLSVRASGLTLTWDERGGLRLEVDRLTLVGRDNVTIETQGNLELRAGGRMSLAATDQTITATVGDVQIVANDDVALSGEKILLNR